MAKQDDKKKVKVPKSLFELKWSVSKFAKEKGIRLKGKGMSKKRKKEAKKKLRKMYALNMIGKLDKAVKIIASNPTDNKKILKLRSAIDNIIFNPEIMEQIAAIYKKDRKAYPNLMFFPYMITSTLLYYKREGLTDEEKEYGEKLDKEVLLDFCGRVLKKQIAHYESLGMDDATAFELACVIPDAEVFTTHRQWYRRLIMKMYELAGLGPVDLDDILKAVRSCGKSKEITKKDFLEGFYTTFMMTKATNKIATYNDHQKELHETLINETLKYLEDQKDSKRRELIKGYIRARKNDEDKKRDGKRVIKFVDQANSNSAFTGLKSTVQDLISDNPNHELYLS